eukprot:CAMPEP_0198215316 /NCGR_PEP_ID=MMETSP1445-20131203/48910_1 /TAXON_ID=36898 /ORGANISM="Pyramimonas sp., Strain CCMP2087" /LENGTH=344 /DNA_ID=CAMNT_0043890989 /DNA_START=593 /DNA_END=1627 /DNA_ORIENTATION=+
MLLPIVRERPHLMGTPRYPESQGMISLSHVFDVDHFCKYIESIMEVCIRCENFPAEHFSDLPADATFEAKYQYGIKHYSMTAYPECNNDAALQRCVHSKHHPVIMTVFKMRSNYGSTSEITYSDEALRFYAEAFRLSESTGKLVSKIRRRFLGQPYIGLHMNTEDHYARHWKDRFQTGDNISSMLNFTSYELQLPSTPIYLATGQPDDAIQTLRKLHPEVKIVHRKMILGDSEPEDYIIQAAVDQEMCKYSKAFISTDLSSFGTNTFFTRSSVYATGHPESPVYGPSYSYAKREGGENCTRILARIGIRATTSENDIAYATVTQQCNQPITEFLEALFVGADEP